MREIPLKSHIRRALGKRTDLRLFNNPVGEGWVGRLVSHSPQATTLTGAQRVKYGLVDGASDLVGWRTIVITPEMVGQKIAQFVGMEIKTDSGRLRKEQARFIVVLNEAGGHAVVVRSVEEAVRAV